MTGRHRRPRDWWGVRVMAVSLAAGILGATAILWACGLALGDSIERVNPGLTGLVIDAP